jgi:hypothetical protein
MTERRRKGDDSIYFEHDGSCRDAERHRRCKGRWRGERSVGWSAEGRWLRRRDSGPTKAVQHSDLFITVLVEQGPTYAGDSSPRGIAVRRVHEQVRQADRDVLILEEHAVRQQGCYTKPEGMAVARLRRWANEFYQV